MRLARITAILATLVVAGPAAGSWRGSDWPVVASASYGDCELEVSGNGKMFLIAARGLGAEGPARLQLANGDMTPIDWNARAGADGRFARYYMPFRFNRDGGVVAVSVDAPQCALTASFGWQRGIRVFD